MFPETTDVNLVNCDLIDFDCLNKSKIIFGSGKAILTFGHANVMVSVFIDHGSKESISKEMNIEY